jgi:RNA polymerase sigma-70 factor (ECF subfamily)
MSTIELNHQLASLHAELYTFTRRFTRDRDESLDLVQDTLLRAIQYKEKFRENTNLKGWLFTIMRNTFINNYRKDKRSKTSRDTTKDLYFLNVEDTHTFNKPEKQIEYDDIWKNIDALQEDLRTPFKLYTSGYKYHEIAEHLNIPLGTVKNRIFNARKVIKQKLAGY